MQQIKSPNLTTDGYDPQGDWQLGIWMFFRVRLERKIVKQNVVHTEDKIYFAVNNPHHPCK